LQGEFVFLRNESLFGTEWARIPFLSSNSNTEATLSSPDQFSNATTNQGCFNSSYASFQCLVTASTNGPWALGIDPNGNSQNFDLNVSFPNFSESLFGPVSLTSPTSLTIRYVRELTDDQVLVSGPADAIDFAATGTSWSPTQVKARSEGSFQLSIIPEPSAALLFGLGLWGFGFCRTRRA
jgi:hypothetical protein